MVPAAAVIPAPVAYIKVAAVKKLVVEILLDRTDSLRFPALRASVCNHFHGIHLSGLGAGALP